MLNLVNITLSSFTILFRFVVSGLNDLIPYNSFLPLFCSCCLKEWPLNSRHFSWFSTTTKKRHIETYLGCLFVGSGHNRLSLSGLSSA